MEDFEVHASSRGTLIVSGDLDAVTAPRFETAVFEVISYCGSVVIDMAGVRFIDTTGFRSIMQAASGLDGGALLRLENVRPNVMKVLRILGLDEIPGVHASEQEQPRQVL